MLTGHPVFRLAPQLVIVKAMPQMRRREMNIFFIRQGYFVNRKDILLPVNDNLAGITTFVKLFTDYNLY